MPFSYSPITCDLCGNPKAEVLLEKDSPVSVLSDSKITQTSLRKLECLRCGLVRDGHELAEAGLKGYYQSDYTLNVYPDEYHFLTPAGAIPRSQLFFDWMLKFLGSDSKERIRKVLEIGCGAGHLIRRVQTALPQARCYGLEINAKARAIAIEKGCQVLSDEIDQVKLGKFDLIYVIGVIEHVTRPGDFLAEIRQHLSDKGILILSQPTQDVLSSDIYFSDHLHHFGSDHLKMYAQKTGFIEISEDIGHPLMPNFSLHVWKPAELIADYVRWGHTCCRASVAYHEAMFERVNLLVDGIGTDSSRGLAVFGLNERYALLRAYSRLGDTAIVCGLSDVDPYAPVDFPVVKPERVKEFPVTDVLLCVNRVHQDYVSRRLAPLGVTVHSVDV
jgi:SAM-dependent methyltransferase